MQLKSFDTDAFLADYWQKKPLLIRNPWKAWHNPLEPDELAGLACEEEVESRLITQAADAATGRWQVENGPLAEGRFSELGDSVWTLLVQAVDHHVPEVAALMEPFRFVPNWRIDDIMVSYATDGGGVGPHFDQYDVFLVQGSGRRRWRIGTVCDAASELQPHNDLRLLADFEATDEWILEPGDILYLPPGVAHDGIAVGEDCMTYSIGFRAPARAELIERWSEDLADRLDDWDRYSDPGLQLQKNPGEISSAAIAELHDMVVQEMLNRESFARWFGQYSSMRKYPEIDWRLDQPIDPATIKGRILERVPLSRNPASRFSFIRQGRDALLLFVDGECFECAGLLAALAQDLCGRSRIEPDLALAESEAASALIAALVNQGSIAFESEG